jgi:GNAT superfamily N-acetyltransferase
MTARDAVEVRPSHPDDRSGVLDLLSASLQWVPNELFDRFFSWKHEQNPFGESPAWVACDRGRIVGFRTFMRWELDHPDGRVRRAVRAVDTATHPDYQGRGIFRRLTLHAIEDLAREGVDFVFNTPNEQSRPGYLAMGWESVGHLPVAIRPRGPRGALAMLRSRVPAERWSLETRVGSPASDVLEDPGTADLLAHLSPTTALRTRRSTEYMRWRYGFDALGYRALAADGEPARGLAVFRLRRRGTATEVALVEVLVPQGAHEVARSLRRDVARVSDADYVIRLGGPAVETTGYVRLPHQGPILTWRAVCATGPAPGLGAWDLALGDIELL